MEFILTIITEKKIINRGFLIGPVCPIYGVGIILLTFILKNITNFFILFILTFIICSILEYSVSFLMEKLFNLRWWDYKKRKFNINGRICLGTMIPFSLLGFATIKYINPLFIHLINHISSNYLTIFVIILIIIFVIDNIYTFIKVKNIKKKKRWKEEDATEKIKAEMKK